MRHDSKRKLARNEKLRQMRMEHPELALSEIAQAFGISRERVRQILQRTEEIERELAAMRAQVAS